MKHLKFMLLALCMVMGFTMTSCLGDDDDYEQYYPAIAKLHYPYEFTAANGMVIQPTPESIATIEKNAGSLIKYEGQIFYILYTLPEGQVNDENTKVVKNANVKSMLPLDEPVEIVEEEGAPNDSVNNCTIFTLMKDNDEQYKPAFFDRESIIIYAQYGMEQTAHDFTLMYYPELQEKDQPLTLYLHHDDNKDLPTPGYTSYDFAQVTGNLSFFYKTFNLEKVLYFYQGQFGLSSIPSTINVVTYENQTSNKIDNAQTQKKTYTITYLPNKQN